MNADIERIREQSAAEVDVLSAVKSEAVASFLTMQVPHAPHSAYVAIVVQCSVKL